MQECLRGLALVCCIGEVRIAALVQLGEVVAGVTRGPVDVSVVPDRARSRSLVEVLREAWALRLAVFRRTRIPHEAVLVVLAGHGWRLDHLGYEADAEGERRCSDPVET